MGKTSLISRLMRVCVTLVAGLSSRPRPGLTHPRPSPPRMENAAHPKSATGATTCSKLRVCYAALPTLVWPHVRSIHVPWSILPVQENTHRSLLSGNITRPSIRRWRLPWISEFFNNAETNFAFTSKKPWQSSVIAHNLIVVMKTWVQDFWLDVLCAVSRSQSCSRYHFYWQCRNLSSFFLSKRLVIFSLFHELFLPFFVSSFDPFAPRSRFHLNLAKALPASLYMRTTIFLSSCMVVTLIFHPPFFTNWRWRRRRNVFARLLE